MANGDRKVQKTTRVDEFTVLKENNRIRHEVQVSKPLFISHKPVLEDTSQPKEDRRDMEKVKIEAKEKSSV